MAVAPWSPSKQALEPSVGARGEMESVKPKETKIDVQ